MRDDEFVLFCKKVCEDAHEIAMKIKEYSRKYNIFLLSVEQIFVNGLRKEIYDMANEMYDKELLEEYYKICREGLKK